MSALERRLEDALQAAAQRVDPAPDLFQRVQGTVEDDRRRRRAIRRGTAAGVLALAVVGTGVVLVSDRADGRLDMAWWVLEVITSAALVALALWLGPFIKRFGRSYAADVFRANPRTGKSYIVLTDIVYYLIFTAYILFTVRFQPPPEWSDTVGAAQLQFTVARVGGILLIIGVLHGLNLLVMPVLGRLFSLNRRLDEEMPPR